MSIPRIEVSENPIDREQSVNNLIESVALMETGLSHIINAEGEKIQKVIKYDSEEEVLLDDILKVNDSAQKMINSISKLEMVLQNKLETSKSLEDSVNIPGPIGPMGPQGLDGEAATIEVGTVSSLEFSNSYVVNVGTPTHAILNFGIPAGPQGPAGPAGADAITEFATYYKNSGASYSNGELIKFDAVLVESGITIDSTGTNIKLGDKKYYKISFGINVLTIDSGQPRLELRVNGNSFIIPTNMNMTKVGYSSLDFIYPLAPNDVISFAVVNGGITLYPNYTGITAYATITSIK